MLEKNSEFYLSQPVIFFGVQEVCEEDLFEELNTNFPYEFSLRYPLSSSEAEIKTGMYIDWYDLPFSPEKNEF